MVHDQMTRFFTRLPPRRAPDGGDGRRGRGAVGLLSRLARHLRSAAPRDRRRYRLIAKMPTIAAMAYKYNMGQPFMYPQKRAGLHGELHAHDVRHALRGVRAEPGAGARARPHLHPARRSRAECLDLDGAPGRARRGANPFACIAAGIACLWGPAHGGANEACLQMLEEIGDVSRVGEFIKRRQGQELDGFKLMGFGHRVYKNFDPRAKLMRETCHEVLDELGLRERPRCSSWPWSWRRSRSRTTTSSRASSTRTSTSTPASCRARIGIPDLDVHLHLRAGAHRRLDGAVERNDRPIRSTRSAVRASSTPARRSATSCRSASAETREFRPRPDLTQRG